MRPHGARLPCRTRMASMGSRGATRRAFRPNSFGGDAGEGTRPRQCRCRHRPGLHHALFPQLGGDGGRGFGASTNSTRTLAGKRSSGHPTIRVGRLTDGAKLHRGVIAREPVILAPMPLRPWGCRTLAESRRPTVCSRGERSLASQPPVRSGTRVSTICCSAAAPAPAAALVQDPETRPSGISDTDVQALSDHRSCGKQKPRISSEIAAAVDFAIRRIRQGRCSRDCVAVPICRALRP